MSQSRDCSTGLVSTIREYLYIGRISFCYGAEAASIHSDHTLPHIQLTGTRANIFMLRSGWQRGHDISVTKFGSEDLAR